MDTNQKLNSIVKEQHFTEELIKKIVEENDLSTEGLLLAKKLLDNKPEAMSAAKSLILKYHWNYL